MNWTGKDTGIMFVSLAAGAVIGALGWQVLQEDGVQAPRAPASESAQAGNFADLQAENSQLKQQLDDLQAKSLRRELEAEPAKTDGAAEAVATEGEIAAKAEAAYRVMFSDPKFKDVLAKIDWQVMGNNMKDMVPLIAELAESMAAGEPPSLELVGEIQKLNGDLLAIAGTIAEGDIPGEGINGAFTHPLVVANQLSATLQAAGLSLTEAQKQGLDVITKHYAAIDEGLRLSPDSDALGLENLLKEAEYKDGLYREARALLTPEQQKALYSEHSEGRLSLDMFDSSLMLGAYAQPLPVTDSKHLASILSREFVQDMSLSEAEGAKLDGIIQKWANNLPASYWSNKADALDMKGMMKSDRVREAMGYQVALMREILSKVDLNDAERAELMRSKTIVVPLPR